MKPVKFIIQADVEARKAEDEATEAALKEMKAKEKADKACTKESPLCFARIQKLEAFLDGLGYKC